MHPGVGPAQLAVMDGANRRGCRLRARGSGVSDGFIGGWADRRRSHGVVGRSRPAERAAVVREDLPRMKMPAHRRRRGHLGAPVEADRHMEADRYITAGCAIAVRSGIRRSAWRRSGRDSAPVWNLSPPMRRWRRGVTVLPRRMSTSVGLMPDGGVPECRAGAPRQAGWARASCN